VSPPKKHVPDDARNTSVRLTEKEREAIHEISKTRRANGNSRTRINDILVDSLWGMLKRETGKTEADMEALLPVVAPRKQTKPKIAQMPKPETKY